MSTVYVAAFQSWGTNYGTQLSRLVVGEEEVSLFIENSYSSFARLHVFTDLEEANKEYSRYSEYTWSINKNQR